MTNEKKKKQTRNHVDRLDPATPAHIVARTRVVGASRLILRRSSSLPRATATTARCLAFFLLSPPPARPLSPPLLARSFASKPRPTESTPAIRSSCCIHRLPARRLPSQRMAHVISALVDSPHTYTTGFSPFHHLQSSW